MPYRRRRSYQSRRSRRRTNSRRLAIRRMPQLVPDAVRVPLRWSHNYQPIAIVSEFYEGFSLNGPYAPVPSGGQPLGFAQWGTFYNRYKVEKSRIKVTFYMNSVGQYRLTLYPASGETLWTTELGARQAKFAKSLIIGHTVNIGQKEHVMYHEMSVKKLLGQEPLGVNYEAVVSALPSREFYWNVIGHVFNGDLSEVRIMIEVTYDCKFFEAASLAS